MGLEGFIPVYHDEQKQPGQESKMQPDAGSDFKFNQAKRE